MAEPPGGPSNEGEWRITDHEAARLGPAIVDLLRSIPETWAELDFDQLTSLQERSLFFLTAAGMVERRGWFRSTMVNHPTAFEVRFQATGEFGFVLAMEQATSVTYQTWRDAWRAWNEGAKEGRSPFHVYSLKPQEWRLTDQGVLACNELNSAVGKAGDDTVVDFVLKRGLYGPGYWLHRVSQNRPPTADEQRVIEKELAAGRTLDELSRPPVGGSGKILETRTTEQSEDPAEVNISNWKEGAEAFLAVLSPFFESMANQSPSPNSEADEEDTAPTSPTEDIAAPTLMPFQDGDMVFFPDRVTLCGATICSGRRSRRQRAVLDLLRVKRSDGQFASYSSKDFAELVGLKDADGVPGLIRDLRNQISKCLRDQAGIDCGRKDVILSGDQGYRFSQKLSVQDGGDSGGEHVQRHTAGGAVGHDADREADDRDRDADDPCHDANRGRDRDADHSHVSEADAAARVRQEWILKELGKGRKLQTPNIVDELKCSRSTAQRDLDALKDAGKIEYVGPPRSGHYRLTNGE